MKEEKDANGSFKQKVFDIVRMFMRPTGAGRIPDCEKVRVRSWINGDRDEEAKGEPITLLLQQCDTSIAVELGAGEYGPVEAKGNGAQSNLHVILRVELRGGQGVAKIDEHTRVVFGETGSPDESWRAINV